MREPDDVGPRQVPRCSRDRGEAGQLRLSVPSQGGGGVTKHRDYGHEFTLHVLPKEVWRRAGVAVCDRFDDVADVSGLPGDHGGTTSMSLNELRDRVHRDACSNGWWEEPRSFGELIALVHSELSEALEDHRNGYAPDQWYPELSGKPVGIPTELADVIIRVLDMCGAYGIDIDRVVQQKLEYNLSRGHRHGGKAL